LASQLRFEGGELEELLERVRNEVGPDARIVAANRIRQGGVAGFFARQGFEVVVDVDNAQDVHAGRGPRGRRNRTERRPTAPAEPTTAPAAAPAVTASVLDLVDEVNDAERDQIIDLN